MSSSWNKSDYEMKRNSSFRWIKNKEGDMKLLNSRSSRKKEKDKMRKGKGRRWKRMVMSRKKELKKCSEKSKKRWKDRNS